jgi:hypothetical protein
MKKLKENNLVAVYRDGSRIVKHFKLADDSILTPRELAEYQLPMGRTKTLIMIRQRLQSKLRTALDVLLAAEGETKVY